MRTAHSHHALVDVCARHPLGLLVRGLHHLSCRPKIGDQPLSHSGRFHKAVTAIAQRAFIHIGGQHPRPGAAHIEHHDQFVLLLAHRSSLTGP